MRCLNEYSYRRNYIAGLTLEKSMLLQTTKIAQQIRITKIIRPHETFQPEECVLLIEKELMYG